MLKKKDHTTIQPKEATMLLYSWGFIIDCVDLRLNNCKETSLLGDSLNICVPSSLLVPLGLLGSVSSISIDTTSNNNNIASTIKNNFPRVLPLLAHPIRSLIQAHAGSHINEIIPLLVGISLHRNESDNEILVLAGNLDSLDSVVALGEGAGGRHFGEEKHGAVQGKADLTETLHDALARNHVGVSDI